MRVKSLLLAAAGAIVASLVPQQAEAYLMFCNGTARTQNVSVAYQDGDHWTSEGWWVITSGDCKQPIGGDLRYRTYYYRIKSEGVSRKQGANYYFCTKTQPYTITGSHSKAHCANRNYFRRGFKKLDVGEAVDFTVNIE
jgi:uncharacterized membrane protein